ncbi:MAG: (deoxy)nucleoside triphosphate pyrophosphohydrolase [Rhodospirillales bacterium]|nr:(deoxy)nucleoside triphosphate pyrophosphohydrolase [Rhodospirillales bacterium]MCB9973590.1 (deoxy)nucleoside triphosphate pyrophosphohydrolase [Rhodospirillales bacterium]
MSSCEQALLNPVPEAPVIERVLLVVAAALIDVDGRVLCAQRPAGKWMAGQWEFPGGKLEEGETPEYALVRELREELGIETRPTCFTPIGFASHTYEDKKLHLLMPLYACRFWQGTPVPCEQQNLKWLRPQEMYQKPFVPADQPLFPVLEAYLG